MCATQRQQPSFPPRELIRSTDRKSNAYGLSQPGMPRRLPWTDPIDLNIELHPNGTRETEKMENAQPTFVSTTFMMSFAMNIRPIDYSSFDNKR